MDKLGDDKVALMYTENIPYTRIDVNDFLTSPEFQEKLANPQIFELFQAKSVQYALLNLSRMSPTRTDDLEWIVEQWFGQSGLAKLSVVVNSDIYDFFGAILKNMETPNLRFFYDEQFYDGWEAVNWFEETSLDSIT